PASVAPAAAAAADAGSHWCSCTPGWGGAACSRCQAGWPLACASLLPRDPKANCVSSLGYNNRTLYKVYSCNVEESMTRFLLSLESYCSSVPISPLLPAYDKLANQLNLTTFDMSRYATAAGGGAAPIITNTTNSTAAAGSGGNSSVVSSPYCLVALRGGKYFTEEVLQCMGLGCHFAEGSQSYTCSGGMRCGCPSPDPAAAAAGAPVSLSYCGKRIQSLMS
ncbi:hypothetical protein Vafri_13009, partial [Volvox africanus]